jgi:hypothetical protein
MPPRLSSPRVLGLVGLAAVLLALTAALPLHALEHLRQAETGRHCPVCVWSHSSAVLMETPALAPALLVLAEVAASPERAPHVTVAYPTPSRAPPRVA